MMKKLSLVLSICCLYSACTLLPPQPLIVAPESQSSIAADKARCASLNNKWLATSIITGATGGLATASGIGASVSAATNSPTSLTAGFGASGVVLGIVAAITGGLSGKYAQEYVNQCTINAAGR